MDLYVSKQCQHCTQLLTLLRDNPQLQSYFIVKPIETNSYPKDLKVVPTLIKDGQLYTGTQLNANKFGHTQIYVGDINSSGWTSSKKENYNGGFVYTKYAYNNYDLIVFRGPRASSSFTPIQGQQTI